MQQFASEYRGRVTVGRVDVEKHRNLAQQQDIRVLPSFVVFKDGQKMAVQRGYRPGVLEELAAKWGA